VGRAGGAVTGGAFVLAVVLIASGIDPFWETLAVLAAVVWVVFVSAQLLRVGSAAPA
jgi:hypothetical protein